MSVPGSGSADIGRDRDAGRDLYAEWDAAYVLGSLASEERHDYERHLRICADCTRRVAEAVGMPGLLGLVPIDQVLGSDGAAERASDFAESLGTSATLIPPGSLSRDDGLPRLLATARRRRRRGRMLQAGLLISVAAAAATIAFVLPTRPTPVGPEGQLGELITLRQVVPNPLTAGVRFATQPGGTRIDGSCGYGSHETVAGATAGDLGGAVAERVYAMFVTDRNGETTQVASWSAGPGMTVPIAGTTRLAADEILSVDIRLQPNGTVLLAGRPGQPPAP